MQYVSIVFSLSIVDDLDDKRSLQSQINSTASHGFLLLSNGLVMDHFLFSGTATEACRIEWKIRAAWQTCFAELHSGQEKFSCAVKYTILFENQCRKAVIMVQPCNIL